MENELSLSVARVPARRFVYLSYNELPLDWNTGLEKVNSFVESIPTLTFAHNKTILSIRKTSHDDIDCKVGREVVGYYDLDEENEEQLGIVDGLARECYRFNLGQIPTESLTFDKFLELERELRKKTADFGAVEEEWRISIDITPSSETSPLKILAEIQFFSKI